MSEKTSLYKRIVNFIDRKSPYEDEVNGLLFLIRRVLLIWIPFYLVMSVYSAVEGLGIQIILTFIAGIAVYIGIFSATYFRHSIECLFCLMLSVTLIAGYLTVQFGWRCSFQNFIYVTFLILWYNPGAGIKMKAVNSVVLALAVCVISYLTPFGTTTLSPEKTSFYFVVYTNIVLFTICLAVVAYYFCTQYTETEHTVREYNKKLKILAETDALTKLVNRRFAENELLEIEKSSISQKYLFCIAIGDIDLFKNVNDTYGHEAGDYLLAELARMFKSHMKGNDGFVARWGGEEFIFVLRHVNGDEAQTILDKLRHDIKHTDFTYDGNVIRVTMTFGIEEYSSNDGIDGTIAKADKKLYIGKQSGRDRTVF